MLYILLVPVLCLNLFAESPKRSIAAEQVVQSQVEAYNKGDVEKFLECYSENVQTIDFSSGKVIESGLVEMKKSYTGLFKQFPKLNCQIKTRIVQGDYVIDQEIITGIGDNSIIGTAIYQVLNGKIIKVWFLLS